MLGTDVVGGPNSGGQNTVTVASSGQVASTGNGIVSFGALSTVVNNGLVTAGLVGIKVFGGGNSVVNSGTITGATGIVGASDETAVGPGTASGHVLNRGVIEVAAGSLTLPGARIDVAGNYLVENQGTLQGGTEGVRMSGSGNTLANSGSISAAANGVIVKSGAGDVNAITNSGDILVRHTVGGLFVPVEVAIQDADGSAHVTNSGHIAVDPTFCTAVSLGNGVDTLENLALGIISGDVDMGGTTDTSADTVANAGSIDGSIAMGAGADTVTNSGHVGGSINMGAGTFNDVLVNSGLIDGAVAMGNGDDAVDNSTGRISGNVNLGAGNDVYTGGTGGDRVIGAAGNDAIDLADGNDLFLAAGSDGNDDVDGGAGIDTYSAAQLSTAVTIDLASGTATGADVGADVLLGFEQLIGGSAGDTLTGDDGANRIDGGGGSDFLDGGAGIDRLIGGIGQDVLNGGDGRDVLTGGSLAGSIEADTFQFAAITDSGLTAATRDVITDFTDHGSAAAPFAPGADRIDLHLIDANTGVAGNQVFSFIGTAAFSGVAGELRYVQNGNAVIVSGDTNGDARADFSIQINGTHTLFASDFLL